MVPPIHIVLLTLNLALSSITAYAAEGESKVLQIEKKNLPIIESKPTNLKIRTLEPMQVGGAPQLVAPNLPTSASVPPSSVQTKEPPFPKSELVALETGVRLFPVMTDGERLYVSLYGEGFTISSELESRLTEEYRAHPSADFFYIEGDLATKALNELKISNDETVFWSLFNQSSEKKVEIRKVSKLLVKPNGAGDGVFGTVGVELGPADDKTQITFNAVGLASVGKSSQLANLSTEPIQWSSSTLNLPSEKTLEQAEFISPRGESGARTLKRPLQFEMTKLGDVEFIQATAQFSRKEYMGQPDYTETMYGYFLRSGSSVKALKDFYIDTTYFQKPDKIILGKWVHGYDATLYISSTGMGDCGRFVLSKKGVGFVVVPARCGSWGC